MPTFLATGVFADLSADNEGRVKGATLSDGAGDASGSFNRFSCAGLFPLVALGGLVTLDILATVGVLVALGPRAEGLYVLLVMPLNDTLPCAFRNVTGDFILFK